MTTKLLSRVFASAAVAAGVLCCNPALASHHFESTIVLKTPSLNQTDNYVFPSSRAGYTAIVMIVSSVPKAGPGGIFAKDALYNIHVGKDADFKTGYTFSLAFNDAQYTLHELSEPNAAVGAMGAQVGTGTIGKPAQTAEGIKVWTGAVKDPFYGNSPGLHIFRNQRDMGVYDPTVWKSVQGANIFNGRNAGAIVLEVPNSMLGSDVKVFMTTALKQGGEWTQVQYSANPLFSHSMLFEMDALKMEHDRGRPGKDDDLRHVVAASVTRMALLSKSQADPLAYGDKIATQLVPDVLNYKPGTRAEFAVAQRNGRSLDDDAMSVMLSLLMGKAVDQAIPNPKLYSADFPFVIPVELK